MTDSTQLITILVTAAVTLGVTLVTTTINRRFARADEREVYERNTKREDRLRLREKAVLVVTDMLTITDQIYDTHVELTMADQLPPTQKLREHAQLRAAERVRLMRQMKQKLTEAMLLAPNDIGTLLNQLVAALQRMEAAKQLPSADHATYLAFVDARLAVVQAMRAHMAVDDRVVETTEEKNTPWWGALAKRLKT